MELTSQQKLKQKLAEGKISRERYEELVSGLQEGEIKHLMMTSGVDKNASRKRVLKYSLLLSAAALPIGLYLSITLVWVLSLVGIVVVAGMYLRLDSWD